MYATGPHSRGAAPHGAVSRTVQSTARCSQPCAAPARRSQPGAANPWQPSAAGRQPCAASPAALQSPHDAVSPAPHARGPTSSAMTRHPDRDAEPARRRGAVMHHDVSPTQPADAPPRRRQLVPPAARCSQYPYSARPPFAARPAQAAAHGAVIPRSRCSVRRSPRSPGPAQLLPGAAARRSRRRLTGLYLLTLQRARVELRRRE
jgi:hypothetical protein